MKNSTYLIAATLFFGLGLTSCKKEGCMDSSATNYNPKATTDDGSCEYAVNQTTAPGAFTPNFSGEFGALIAIKTITTTSTPIGSMDVEAGTAVAVFSANGGQNFLGAGTVNCNSNNLTAQNNNSYVYMINQTQPTGLSFGSTVNWGATGGDWQSFSGSTSQGFATISDITSGNVALASSYTLQNTTTTNADSILYAVYGPSGSKVVIVAGSNTSHTFSTSDLSGIGTGNGFVQIVGLNYDPQTIGGKNYYFINETVRTKSVTIE